MVAKGDSPFPSTIPNFLIEGDICVVAKVITISQYPTIDDLEHHSNQHAPLHKQATGNVDFKIESERNSEKVA